MKQRKGRVYRILHPEVFQGKRSARGYFEGWYFKHVSRATGAVTAVIPGVAFDAAGSGHSFIQLIDGATGGTVYAAFGLGEFEASEERLDIRIAGSRFTETGMTLDFSADGMPVRAEIGYSKFTRLTGNPLSPGIMGWYSWVPFMECYHGVVSLDHRVDGYIRTGDTLSRFPGGEGYIEKDWGRSFPTSWIWLQSNSFDEPGTCLSFSIARIPWLAGSFPGFICVFLLRGREYRFATYTGARVTGFQAGEDSAMIRMEDGKHRLTLSVRKRKGGLLRAPVKGSMDRRIAESIDASVDVTLERGDGGVVFTGSGIYTGAEAVGDVSGLGPRRTHPGT